MIREDVQVKTPVQMTVMSPILVTDAAAVKLRDVMKSKGLPDGTGLRVFVSGGGCSGFQYGMAFEKAGEADDNVFESGGVTVFVDPISIQYLDGASIDFVDSLMGGGFKIENPNAVSSCGCGSSFKAAGAEGAAPKAGGGCGCH
jgi:iron-sulfur cluster assembly protein